MKKINTIYTLIVFSLLFLLLGSTAFANDNNIDFSVTLKPSKFQVGDDYSYFDLNLKPNEEENLSLLITNNGNQKLNLIVSPTDATTNQEGMIDYSIKNKKFPKDNTLLVPFTTIVSEAQELTLKPKEQQVVTFKLKMPQKKIAGTILGGFVIQTKDKTNEENNKEKGIEFKNKFEFRKAVVINQEENNFLPDLKVNSINNTFVNNIPATTVNIQNTMPVMFGELDITAEIINKKNKKIVKKQNNTNLEMAPNSNFDFPIYWNNQKLEKGDYTVNILAKSGIKEWNLSKDFAVTKSDLVSFSDYYDDEKKIMTPLWLKITIIGLLISLLLGAIIVYLTLKKTKKNKKNKKKINDNHIKRMN